MTMTAAPHSIDPTTYLDDVLTQASPEMMRQMLQGFINQILSAQADRGCPILCVRGFGLQVVRESVGVSHG